MPTNQLPFYAQTAILDEYIHSDSPESDPVAIDVVIDVLKTREDLRTYFFNQGPHAAWAKILWDYGFFDSPPAPEKRSEGYGLPWWDVQQFLISVAGQAPHIAIKHASTIDAHPVYISRAIMALCSVPVDQISEVIPRILEWLEDPNIAQGIASSTFELIAHFAQQNDEANALVLFQALTAPLPPSETQDVGGFAFRTEARSKYKNTMHEDRILAASQELFTGENFVKVPTILEKHLCLSLKMEAEAAGRMEEEFKSWWRSAIEDTEQDRHKSYKDHLLEILRDIWEKHASIDRAFAETQIKRLLGDEHEILRRLALHILNQFPKQYPELISYVLNEPANLSDVGIHHELFILLQNGYPVITNIEKKRLLKEITQGPPIDYISRLATRAEQNYGEDPKEYTERFSKLWIRDRLWMIRENLEGEERKLLDDLVVEFGQPEHPSFTRWMSSAFSVQDVSPLAKEDLAQLSPMALVKFISEWQPEENLRWGPEEISYQGLANNVSDLVISAPEKYQNYLLPIAICRPVFADTIFRQLAENEQASVPWTIAISLIEELLKNDSVREETNISVDDSWVNVRRGMIRLLQIGLRNKKRSIPFDFLERVRNILFLLIDDPDPTPESDYPREGWFGYNDPATVAINHVRPMALIALMEYSRYRSLLLKEMNPDDKPSTLNPKELDPGVKQILTRKLNFQEEPSWSVRSVYGRYLPLINWFDSEWVKEHIDEILPDEITEESIRLFVAAWDSFVAFNHFSKSMVDILYPKYVRAILHIGKGLVTQTHLDPVQHLATHIGQEYLNSDYDIYTPAGQRSLLVIFYEEAPSESHAHLAWWLWRVCENPDSELSEIWPRIRSLWEWRMQKAAADNYSNTFDREIQWLAHLPEVSPDHETIESMWPLIIDLLPYVTRSEEHDMGWESIENFLAKEVKRAPKQAANLYRLMYEKWPTTRWFHNRSEVKIIIETASHHKDAKQEVLDLLDTMARHNLHHYRYIYDRLT